jgi:hypothetical protein
MVPNPARSVEPGTLPSAIGSPASCPPCPKDGAVTSGSVPTTARKPNDDVTQLLIRREFLIADLREARLRHRSTSDLIARLRAVTLQTLSA